MEDLPTDGRSATHCQDDTPAPDENQSAVLEMQDGEPDTTDDNTLTLIHTVIDTKTSERGEVKVDLSAAKRAATTALSGILVPASVSVSPITSAAKLTSLSQQTSSSGGSSSATVQAPPTSLPPTPVVHAASKLRPTSLSAITHTVAPDTRHSSLLSNKPPAAAKRTPLSDSNLGPSSSHPPMMVLNNPGQRPVIRTVNAALPGRTQSNNGITYILPQHNDGTAMYQQLGTPPTSQGQQQVITWEHSNAFQGTMLSQPMAQGQPGSSTYQGLTLLQGLPTQQLHQTDQLNYQGIPVATVLQGHHSHDAGLVNQQPLLQVTQVQQPAQQQQQNATYLLQLQHERGGLVTLHRPMQTAQMTQAAPPQQQLQQQIFISQQQHPEQLSVNDLQSDLQHQLAAMAQGLQGVQDLGPQLRTQQFYSSMTHHQVIPNHQPLLGHRLLDRTSSMDRQLDAHQTQQGYQLHAQQQQQQQLLQQLQQQQQAMQQQQQMQQVQQQSSTLLNQRVLMDRGRPANALSPSVLQMMQAGTLTASSSPSTEPSLHAHSTQQARLHAVALPRSAGVLGTTLGTGPGMSSLTASSMRTSLPNAPTPPALNSSTTDGNVADAVLTAGAHPDAATDVYAPHTSAASISSGGSQPACPLTAFQVACTLARLSSEQPDSDVTLEQLHSEHQHLLALLGVLLRHGEGATSAAICVELLMLAASFKSHRRQYKTFSAGAQIGFQLVAATLAQMADVNAPAELRHAAAALQPLLVKADPGPASMTQDAIASTSSQATADSCMTQAAAAQPQLPPALSLPNLRSLATLTNRHLNHLVSITSKRSLSSTQEHGGGQGGDESARSSGLASAPGSMRRGAVPGLTLLASLQSGSQLQGSAAWLQSKKLSRSANARGSMHPGMLFPQMSDLVENEAEGLPCTSESQGAADGGSSAGEQHSSGNILDSSDLWAAAQEGLAYDAPHLNLNQLSSRIGSDAQQSDESVGALRKAVGSAWSYMSGPTPSDPSSAVSVFSPSLSSASRPSSAITWATLDTNSLSNYPSASIPSIASLSSQHMVRAPGPSSSHTNMSRLSSTDLAPFAQQWGPAFGLASGWDGGLSDGQFSSPVAHGTSPDVGNAVRGLKDASSSWLQNPGLESRPSGPSTSAAQPDAGSIAAGGPYRRLVTAIQGFNSTQSAWATDFGTPGLTPADADKRQLTSSSVSVGSSTHGLPLHNTPVIPMSAVGDLGPAPNRPKSSIIVTVGDPERAALAAPSRPYKSLGMMTESFQPPHPTVGPMSNAQPMAASQLWSPANAWSPSPFQGAVQGAQGSPQNFDGFLDDADASSLAAIEQGVQRMLA